MPNTPARTLLLIDDESTRLLVARTLEHAGYYALACPNASSAMTAVQDMHTGVLISDGGAPAMDGAEFVRNIRELQEIEALGAIHFILLTAPEDKNMIVRGLEAGADDYLVKPFHHQELLARVRTGQRILALQEAALRCRLDLAKKGLELSNLKHRMQLLAHTDALTGLANRHSFFERFSDFWALCQRHHHPISCIMLDLDRFKNVNDAHGHEAGDEVLRAVARTLRATVRRYDLCGRIGGEEFAVVCPETDLDGAALAAERIREAVAETTIQIRDTRITPTISAGVAQRQPAHASPDALLAQADRLLYAAKQAGRNRVARADNVSPTPPRSPIAAHSPTTPGTSFAHDPPGPAPSPASPTGPPRINPQSPSGLTSAHQTVRF